MGLDVVKFVKTVNGNISALSIENALYHLNTPKFSVSITATATDSQNQDASGGKSYNTAHAFIDVDEAVVLMYQLRSNIPQSMKNVFNSYKGGSDKKFNNQIISRVFHVKHNPDLNNFIFIVEIMEGEQGYAINKSGIKVPGIVKPKHGGKSFMRNSFSLNKDEALYCSYMLEFELQAWRTIINSEFYRHPEKFQRR